MLTHSQPSGFLGFDFFFLLLGEALACIIIGALYLNSYCENEVAKWLIVFGSLCLALWFFEQMHVRSYGGYYTGPGSLGLVGLLALATLAIGIVTSVVVFTLPVPKYDGCHPTLHTGGFALMIIFCVIAGLIVLQVLMRRRTHGVYIDSHRSSGPISVV